MQARFAAESLRNAKKPKPFNTASAFLFLRRRGSMTASGQITRRSHVARRASTLC
jgi:hypothetical protein